MFTGKIQKNYQIARFFEYHKRRAKITMNLHWNWNATPKMHWPYWGGWQTYAKMNLEKPRPGKNCWGWMILHNAFTNICIRKRDFFFYFPHNSLQQYCNYKVDGRRKVEAEESVRLF